MRVPTEPHLPAGISRSARVFRAGLNFWRLRLLRWCVQQALTLGLFVATVTALHHVPESIHIPRGKGKNRGEVVFRTGPVVVIARGLEIASWALWLIQMPLTFALARLDYEMRWYIVSDR